MEIASRISISSHAKINLSLKILGKREDGFHEIDTLMAPISLSDTLSFEKAGHEGIELSCSDPSIPLGEENLVKKAANVFHGKTGKNIPLRIRIEKRIPAGAGLGGGSGNAAAVLQLLDRLCETGLSDEEMGALGAAIGSDVPFFFQPSAARCQGRGEFVEPARMERRLDLLLLKPSFGIETAWAYSRWRDSQELPRVRYQPQRYNGMLFLNDLERPVFEKHIFLACLKNWLLEQEETRVALMSGSGSVLFAVTEGSEAALRLSEEAEREFGGSLWLQVCHTL